MEPIIFLSSIGHLDEIILEELKEDLSKEFQKFEVSINIIKDKFPLTRIERDESRNQYNSEIMLDQLFQYAIKNHLFRVLGVVDVDIYTNGLNFVFGIASSPRAPLLKYYGASIISVTRLRQEFYGYELDKELFRLRTLKEAVHELGHTFGLIHCNNQ